jgi:hypothetical protein
MPLLPMNLLILNAAVYIVFYIYEVYFTGIDNENCYRISKD